jgi:hypothetical protein
MRLFNETQRRELIANGERSAAGEHLDPHPVVKLFTPDAGVTWLLTSSIPMSPIGPLASAIWDSAARSWAT